MNRYSFASAFLFLFLFLSTAALADVVRYTDGSGKTHFVDSVDKVPDAFKDQLAGQRALPAISRAVPGREQLFEQDHYGSGGNGKKVEIFVTSWCPYCKKLEAYLQSEHIKYVRYDIEQDRKGKLLHDQLGGGGVPVTRIGEKEVVHGYDPDRIGRALGTAN
ncbi:MAG: glutaredoxin domain-containing protein [Bdellovibrionota bacterium]